MNRSRRTVEVPLGAGAASRRLGLGLILAGAVAFAVVVVWLPPSRPRTLVAMLLPLATIIGVAVQWFKSDSPSRRAKIISSLLALAAALVLTLASTFPATLLAILWGLPAAMGLTLIAFSLCRRRAAVIRRLAVGAVFLGSLAPWALLRADGASGQMMPNLVWVWEAPASAVPVESDVRASQMVVVPKTATAKDWPGFRGARRDGVVSGEVAAGLDLEWELRPPAEAWRRRLDRGWSSFAVLGDLA